MACCQLVVFLAVGWPETGSTSENHSMTIQQLHETGVDWATSVGLIKRLLLLEEEMTESLSTSWKITAFCERKVWILMFQCVGLSPQRQCFNINTMILLNVSGGTKEVCSVLQAILKPGLFRMHLKL